jgi:hypothetical protein
MVQLIPSGDGYNGKSMLSGFYWDKENYRLTLDEPVDTGRYSVYILGEFE